MLLQVFVHPLKGTISVLYHLCRAVQIGLRIHPVAINVVLHCLVVELVEVMLGQEVLLHGDKVVIQLVDVLKAALFFDVLGILALKVDVSDELAIWCIIFRFLFFFERL